MAASISHTASSLETHALALWEPRRALTLEAARKHSARVRLARRALIVLSGLLAATLVWFFVSAPKRAIPTESLDETVKMVNPIYKGRTADGLPFRLTANEAVRYVGAPDEVELSAPVLNFLRRQGAAESVLLANGGQYNAAAQSLELRGDVRLNTDNGYACQTSHARVVLKEKRIVGDEAISCTGAFGQASGNAFEINDEYTEFVFTDGMSARILPKQADAVLTGANDLALRGGQ